MGMKNKKTSKETEKMSTIKVFVKRKGAPIIRDYLAECGITGLKNEWTETSSSRSHTFTITGPDRTIIKIRTDMQDVINSADRLAWCLNGLVEKKIFQSLRNALQKTRTDQHSNPGISISEITKV